MKKLLLGFILTVFSVGSFRAQCATSCSNYIVSPTTYTTFAGLGGTSGYGVNEQTLSDDATTGLLNIGFTFSFMCTAYSQFIISSNGFISFDPNASQGCCSGQTLPDPNSPNNLISLFWNDLYPPGGGTITYATTGTSPNQKCIITYTNIPFCCTSSPPFSSGQIVLHETTNIIDLYVANQQGNPGSSFMTQGSENSTGTVAFTTPGRNGSVWTASNTAHRYVPAGAPSAPAAIIGNTTACIGTVQTFSILASPGASSYNWTLPGGWTGTSTTTAISTTVGASGSISVTATYTCGLSAPTTLSFTTIPSPVLNITPLSPNLICSGNTIAINVTGPAITYTLEPGGNTNGPPFIVSPNANTTYTLYGTDINGCNSVNNPVVSVFVNDSPTVTVNSGVICNGQSFAITTNGASTYTITGGSFVVSPTTVGPNNYTVVGTGTNGCLSNPAISTVSVVALPNVLAVASKTDICKNEAITLTASGANTYSWSTGATTPIITVTPLNTTLYSVTGYGANNCAKSTNVNVKVSNCVGLNQNSTNDNAFVSVFPNPSSGEFTIKTKAPTNLMIYDMQGKLIYQQKVGEGSSQINLSNYSDGSYLLKATQGDSEQRVILVKQ